MAQNGMVHGVNTYPTVLPHSVGIWVQSNRIIKVQVSHAECQLSHLEPFFNRLNTSHEFDRHADGWTMDITLVTGIKMTFNHVSRCKKPFQRHSDLHLLTLAAKNAYSLDSKYCRRQKPNFWFCRSFLQFSVFFGFLNTDVGFIFFKISVRLPCLALTDSD